MSTYEFLSKSFTSQKLLLLVIVFWGGHMALQCFVPFSLFKGAALSLYGVWWCFVQISDSMVVLQYDSGPQPFWQQLNHKYIVVRTILNHYWGVSNINPGFTNPNCCLFGFRLIISLAKNNIVWGNHHN